MCVFRGFFEDEKNVAQKKKEINKKKKKKIKVNKCKAICHRIYTSVCCGVCRNGKLRRRESKIDFQLVVRPIHPSAHTSSQTRVNTHPHPPRPPPPFRHLAWPSRTFRARPRRCRPRRQPTEKRGLCHPPRVHPPHPHKPAHNVALSIRTLKLPLPNRLRPLSLTFAHPLPPSTPVPCQSLL